MGQTALHIACASGFTDVVEILIKNHARVNIKDIVGRTPLYFATKNNNYEIVQVFLLKTF